MTWPDEFAALGTGGVLTAILYWVVRRVANRLEEVLKQVLALLTSILGKLDEAANHARLEELTRPHPPAGVPINPLTSVKPGNPPVK